MSTLLKEVLPMKRSLRGFRQYFTRAAGLGARDANYGDQGTTCTHDDPLHRIRKVVNNDSSIDESCHFTIPTITKVWLLCYQNDPQKVVPSTFGIVRGSGYVAKDDGL